MALTVCSCQMQVVIIISLNEQYQIIRADTVVWFLSADLIMLGEYYEEIPFCY